MKKILNRPEDYVDEMLAGLTAAHPQYYRLYGDSGKVVARAQPGKAGKVGIVTDGGGVINTTPRRPAKVATTVGIFAKNYFDMREANTIGADKYFHCKANAQAAHDLRPKFPPFKRRVLGSNGRLLLWSLQAKLGHAPAWLATTTTKGDHSNQGLSF